MDEMTDGHWIVFGLFGVACLISLIKWYVKKVSQETIDENEARKKMLAEFEEERKGQRERDIQEGIEYQKEQEGNYPKTLTTYKPGWKVNYEDVKDRGLKSLLKKIYILTDQERKRLIFEFKESIRDTIPNLQKKDLAELKEQLSLCYKSNEYLMYLCFHQNQYIVSIGLGLDYFLENKLARLSMDTQLKTSP